MRDFPFARRAELDCPDVDRCRAINVPESRGVALGVLVFAHDLIAPLSVARCDGLRFVGREPLQVPFQIRWQDDCFAPALVRDERATVDPVVKFCLARAAERGDVIETVI